MVEITSTYEGGLHCAAKHGPSGATLETDAPKDNMGKGESFSPTDLIATALGTCILTTMAIVARRSGVELTGVRYEVTKEMSADAPRRIARLTVDLWLPAAARQLPEGLLKTTAEGCPVHRSLAPEVAKIITFHWA